ncbi:MAG: metallophosphoesterase [Melioribacteraceae bacterium]|nr:metallophosphoesterase [Melioribacteraceae bacterium]
MKRFAPIIIILTLLSTNYTIAQIEIFSFEATADMRNYAEPEYQNSQYFYGTCEAIKKLGQGKFMISPGDIDPPWHVYNTIKSVIGEDYPWYPVVGNHESETDEDMEWLRNFGKDSLKNIINRGPKNCEETTYSFDFENVHFAVINQYFNDTSDVGTNGDVRDSVYYWLKNDLQNSDKQIKLVIGHEPIVSLPDHDNGRHRHKGDNLDAHAETSHRFQMLLRQENVLAYICGHTHNFSFAKINGVNQIDVGHSRGVGDKGAPSTFLKFHVFKDYLTFDVYRDDSNGGEYKLEHSFELK